MPNIEWILTVKLMQSYSETAHLFALQALKLNSDVANVKQMLSRTCGLRYCICINVHLWL